MFLSTKNDGGVRVSKIHILSNNIETMMGCNTNEIIDNFHPDTNTNYVACEIQWLCFWLCWNL